MTPFDIEPKEDELGAAALTQRGMLPNAPLLMPDQTIERTFRLRVRLSRMIMTLLGRGRLSGH